MAEKVWQLFIINPGTLNVENLKAFLKIIKFNPEAKSRFPKGFTLSEDILNNTGGILFPKETELTADYILRLLKLKDNNPDYKFNFTIKKNKNVADFFRGHIKSDFTKMIEMKKSKQEFRKSIGRLEKTVDTYIDEALKDDELIYVLFRGRSIDEVTSKTGTPRYFYHCINVAIYALELIQNSRLTTGINFEKQDLLNITQLSLLHDIGGMENLGQYVELPIAKQKELYLKDTQNSYLAVKTMNLDDELVEAMKSFADFHNGKPETLHKENGMATNYANVLVTADIMDLRTSGLFEDPAPIKSGVDFLYTLVTNKVIRKGFVDALAKGLKMNDLFDFYFELDRLTKSCILKKFARPYPMLGFKSPVLFLCSDHRTDCEHFSKSSKSVNLIKASSGLEPGAYGRCTKLSVALQKFYQTHYSDIKENILLKQEKKSSDKK
ncbi:HD domain-containing protein [candidate division KSB1 bacterium]